MSVSCQSSHFSLVSNSSIKDQLDDLLSCLYHYLVQKTNLFCGVWCMWRHRLCLNLLVFRLSPDSTVQHSAKQEENQCENAKNNLATLASGSELRRSMVQTLRSAKCSQLLRYLSLANGGAQNILYHLHCCSGYNHKCCQWQVVPAVMNTNPCENRCSNITAQAYVN